MKKCEACGKTFDDSVTVCDVCGKELVEVAAEEVKAEEVKAEETKTEETKTEETKPAEKTDLIEKFKSLNKTTKLVVCGVAALVVICLCVICLSMFTGVKSKLVNKNAINIAYSAEEETTYVYDGNGKVKKINTDGTRYTTVATTADNTMMVVTDKEANAYILTIKGLVKFAEEGTNYVVSVDGTGIAYIKDAKNGVGDLMLYNVKSKKASKIDDDVVLNTVVISPDGKTVAYTVKGEDSEDEKAMYSKGGKDPQVISKNSYPVAIANSAKFVYYLKKNESSNYNFYVLKGKDSNKLAENARGSVVYFNKELNEVLFEDEGKAYVSVNGKEKKKINSNSVSSVLKTQNNVFSDIASYMGTATVCDFKSFKGSIVYISGTYYLLKNNYETSKIINTDNVSAVRFSADGKSILFLKKDTLYKVSNIKKPDKQKKLGDLEDYSITTLVALPDLSAVYFLSDGDLYFKKGASKPKKVASDASRISLDTVAGGVYYYIDYSSSEENTLYFSKNGSKKKVVIKDINGKSTVNGSYQIVTKENKKDDAMKDVYLLKGTKAKKIFTR